MNQGNGPWRGESRDKDDKKASLQGAIEDAWAERSFAICCRDFAALAPASRRLVGHLQARAAASAKAA